MNRTTHFVKLAVFGLGAATLLLANDGVYAADHAEAPGAAADPAADIADFYAWHTDNDTVVVALTFAGLASPGDPATYDTEVLYGFHIDNNLDNASDIDIWCRFGTNMAGDTWGVQCMNVPGAGAALEGEVETEIVDMDDDAVKIWAGPREDPFFFDLSGYQETLMTGDIAFDSDNDDFAGTNVTAIVIEMDAATAAAEGTELQTWATTARL